MASGQVPLTLETAHKWAKSGHEWDKVYRFIFLHPENFFSIPTGRLWPIAHQVVFHGDVDLLKRILALFSDDQINIRTLANDKKTLFDVAKDRRRAYPDMYTYIEHLFLQDDLIQAAKQSNWRLVRDILDKDPQLVNEKPPYSSYFLLHYIVQNGDKDILEDLFQSFQFKTNVLSADGNETPLDMAERLKKDDMCSILEPIPRDLAYSDLNRRRSIAPLLRNSDSSSEKLSNSSPQEPSFLANTSTHSLPNPTTNVSLPPIGFSSLLLDISPSGNFSLKTQNPLIAAQAKPTTPESSQQKRTETPTVHTAETTFGAVPVTPITPATSSQVLKNLTCPLTKQMFIDPVIAGDGHTYEREYIAEYVSSFYSSPITGEPMDATFKDNMEIRQIIAAEAKPPPPESSQQKRTETPSAHTTETTSSPVSVTSIKPPTSSQVQKNLTCFLTKQTFIDPVIAGDGQTYEREYIAEYVSSFYSSPITGEPMDDTFKDNIEIRQIIQSMRTKT